MNQVKDISTEQSILKAAEDVFLDKGYAASRTTEIAQRAGVNHAMLHYYFRTKEKLFNQVFEQKIQIFADSFNLMLEQELPFIEKLKLGIETHFDFLAANPKLPAFILGEIFANPEKKEILKNMIMPRVMSVFFRISREIEREIQEGNIQPVSLIDLALNIGSLNVVTIVAAQAFFDGDSESSLADKESFLKHRKANNVDLILKSIQK